MIVIDSSILLFHGFTDAAFYLGIPCYAFLSFFPFQAGRLNNEYLVHYILYSIVGRVKSMLAKGCNYHNEEPYL